MQILKEISLSQMLLQYLLDEDTRQVGLRMVPAGRGAMNWATGGKSFFRESPSGLPRRCSPSPGGIRFWKPPRC